MYVLNSIPFDYPRQTDFQKVYFLVLAVNPALQLPFLRQLRKPFQAVTLNLQIVAFPLCVKDNPVLAV